MDIINHGMSKKLNLIFYSTLDVMYRYNCRATNHKPIAYKYKQYPKEVRLIRGARAKKTNLLKLETKLIDERKKKIIASYENRCFYVKKYFSYRKVYDVYSIYEKRGGRWLTNIEMYSNMEGLEFRDPNYIFGEYMRSTFRYDLNGVYESTHANILALKLSKRRHVGLLFALAYKKNSRNPQPPQNTHPGVCLLARLPKEILLMILDFAYPNDSCFAKLFKIYRKMFFKKSYIYIKI
jgi:hypothetical protein